VPYAFQEVASYDQNSMPVRKNQHGSVKDIRGAQGIQVNGPTGPKSRAVSVLDKVKETKWMNKKHTTVRIHWWSPTQLLTHRRVASALISSWVGVARVSRRGG
jgi:hypothetical protein